MILLLMDKFIFKTIDFPAELKMRQVIIINWVFRYSFVIEIRRNNEMTGEGIT